MKKDILQAWWGIESTKHNKEKYKLSYFRLRTSVQQETALRKGNGEPQPGEVLQQIQLTDDAGPERIEWLQISM